MAMGVAAFGVRLMFRGVGPMGEMAGTAETWSWFAIRRGVISGL